MLQLFFSFRGRLSRTRYWLAETARLVALVSLFAIVAVATGEPREGVAFDQPPLLLRIAWWIAAAIWIYAGLALQAKRSHDRDKSGFWILVNLVPYVGGLIAFIECGCRRGTTGSNRFGPDPLGSDGPPAALAHAAATLPVGDQIGTM